MEQNKQLSPMEQLIEWLKTEESFITDADGREDRMARQAYRNVIAKATKLLTSSSKDDLEAYTLWLHKEMYYPVGGQFWQKDNNPHTNIFYKDLIELYKTA